NIRILNSIIQVKNKFINKLQRRVVIISIMLFHNFNNAQINNKIEGISFNTPCEIEYIRNIKNQNHYNCYYQDNSNYFHDYSITVSNLFNDLNGLSESGVSAYKEEFLKTIKQNSIKEGAILAEYIELSNGTKALLTISSL